MEYPSLTKKSIRQLNIYRLGVLIKNNAPLRFKRAYRHKENILFHDVITKGYIVVNEKELMECLDNIEDLDAKDNDQTNRRS